jgi:hypothetical protein
MVRVRFEVNCRDVWAIVEFVGGQQNDLFLDPGVMIARKLAFADEATQWHTAQL